MEKQKIIIAAVLAVIMFFLLSDFTFDLDFSSSGKSIGDGKFKACGKEYHGAKRYLLSDTPQKFTLPLGTYYSFWYDNAEESTPFQIQYEINGTTVDSDKVKHVPTNKIYVSRTPGTKKQWITIAYTK